MENKRTQKVKRLLSFMLIIGVIISLAACKSRELSTNPTAYYIVYSGIDKGDSRIEGIDVDGNPTAIHDIEAINIAKSALVGGGICCGRTPRK